MLNLVFDSLKSAAKCNNAFSSESDLVEKDSCCIFYPHENKLLMKRSKLAATEEDWTEFETLLNSVDVTDSYTRDQANIEWKFHHLSVVTFFAVLLGEVFMGCWNDFLTYTLNKKIPSIV